MVTRYYTASSIDGFIADPDNSLSWLLTRDVDPAGPMSVDALLAETGALAMGRTTYEWILDNPQDDGAAWLYQQPAWVFTHHDLPRVDGDVRFTQEPVEVVHAQMIAAAGGRDLWVVGGGDLAGQFADAGLLDEVWVQYAPVALGGGAPLLPRRLELELLDVARNRDFVCSRHRVVRAQR
ncbi:dihydrofolate reductase family protein [Georgenia sp. TF02-10]|uniref:dihydrofolate reductase family protein n=1 Tax=Georgenia sp. TF02-10 TaxID=2917725 RepID=UPI001FA761E9|nr:dihydrofolate reductase family protein [Georgenia sp. TF02-10]UNX54258.1 dihydrofolate reductase family protein [Georgenia sp. TF02-10]